MIEIVIEYTNEDKENYQKALRTYMNISKSKYQYIIYVIMLLIFFSLLTGMYSSNIVHFRYYNFIILFIIPILTKLYFLLRNKYIIRINSKFPNIDRPFQKVTLDNKYITMDTFDSTYIYKDNWFKYLILYNDNITLASSDLSGIIIPKRYLTETVKNEIHIMFNDIEKIEIS